MATVTVSVGVTGVEQLASRFTVLAETMPEVTKALLTQVALLVAVEARGLAGDSQKTVPTIVVVPSEQGVAVQAGGRGSPLPALRERGYAKKPGATWRHPLFGDKEHWYPQKTHPYLRPAELSTRAANLTRIARGVGAESVRVTGTELPEG